MEPVLDLLFERPGLPSFDLGNALAARYGGTLGFERPRLFANFVSSIDGVVALAESRESGRIVSAASDADRFVMGLLRVCADAIVVGAGTFRKAPGDVWNAESLVPSAAPLFSELRARLGLAPKPLLVVATASGDIDTTRPALAGAWIFTSSAGETRLRERLPAGARISVLDSGSRPLSALVQELHRENLRLILTEGGPSLFAQLFAEDVVDELFLTISPLLFGTSPGDGRKSLIHGVDLAGTSLDLLSARRHGSHLFLRYERPRAGSRQRSSAR